MYSERTNNRNRFAIRLILLVLIAVTLFTLAVAVQPSQAQSNPTLVVDMSGLQDFVGSLQLPNIPVMIPTNGGITYSCPNEATCDRVGSFEWFKANQTANAFVIGTYGGALVWEIDGYERNIDYTTQTDQNGTTIVTFAEEVEAGTNLLIHIRSLTAVAEYGVR